MTEESKLPAALALSISRAVSEANDPPPPAGQDRHLVLRGGRVSDDFVEPTPEEEFAGRMDAADREARLGDEISRRRQERRLVEAMTAAPAAGAAPDLDQLRELLTAVKNDPMAGLPWWLDSTPGGDDDGPDGTTDAGGIVAGWDRTVHDNTGAAVGTEPAVNELGSIHPPLAEALAVAAVNVLPWLLGEVTELRAIFDLGYRRSEEATALWRAEDPEARAGVHPDLGGLLAWLMDRAAPNRTDIALLLSGTGYEVDDLDDRIAAGYTMRDAVISALAAYDRRADLVTAVEFRAQRAEVALRLAGVHIPTERDGTWTPCTEALLDHLPEWACGKLPRRDRGDGTGHTHWVPKTVSA